MRSWGAGYVTVMPRTRSQSFPLMIKSMCAIHTTSPHTYSHTHGFSFGVNCQLEALIWLMKHLTQIHRVSTSLKAVTQEQQDQAGIPQKCAKYPLSLLIIKAQKRRISRRQRLMRYTYSVHIVLSTAISTTVFAFVPPVLN